LRCLSLSAASLSRVHCPHFARDTEVWGRNTPSSQRDIICCASSRRRFRCFNRSRLDRVGGTHQPGLRGWLASLRIVHSSRCLLHQTAVGKEGPRRAFGPIITDRSSIGTCGVCSGRTNFGAVPLHGLGSPNRVNTPLRGIGNDCRFCTHWVALDRCNQCPTRPLLLAA